MATRQAKRISFWGKYIHAYIHTYTHKLTHKFISTNNRDSVL